MTSKSWTTPVPKPELGDLQFDWNDIRLFVLVAQSGSFRRASNISGKSINSLRRRIKQLEHRMRCRLFVRDVRGAHLTERGSRLFAASERMLNASRDVGAEVQSQADDPRLSVTLNISEGLAVYWLAPRLPEFHSANPDTRIELGCSPESWGTDEPKSDIQIQHSPPTQNDLMMVRLGYVHEQLFASRKTIAEHGNPTSLEELQRFTFVEQQLSTTGSEGLRRITQKLFDPPVALRTTDTCSQHQAIHHGASIGMLPTYIRLFDDQLMPLLDQTHYRQDIFLTYRPEMGQYREVRKVINWLKTTFDAKQYPWFSNTFVAAGAFGQTKGAT